MQSPDLLSRSIYSSEIVNQNRHCTEYTNISTDDDDDDDDNVIKFQKHTKTETSGQKENHTRKNAEDPFKEHTFKEITSAIQIRIREISVAIVLQNQAINMQRVSLFIRRKDTEL